MLKVGALVLKLVVKGLMALFGWWGLAVAGAGLGALAYLGNRTGPAGAAANAADAAAAVSLGAAVVEGAGGTVSGDDAGESAEGSDSRDVLSAAGEENAGDVESPIDWSDVI